METSAFDPSVFMDATTTEALVRRPPLPIASEWVGQITDLQTRAWESKKVDAKVKSGISFDVTIELTAAANPSLKDITGAEKLTLNDTIMLDMTPDGRGIDYAVGKNAALRRYREALDLNRPGEPFNPRMMMGRPIRVKIGHREYPIGSGEFFDQVAAVAKP